MFVLRKSNVQEIDGICCQCADAEQIINTINHKVTSFQWLTILIQDNVFWAVYVEIVNHCSWAFNTDASGAWVEIDNGACCPSLISPVQEFLSHL